MLVRQLEDEVVKAKTQASHTNPEVSAVRSPCYLIWRTIFHSTFCRDIFVIIMLSDLQTV